MYGVVHFPPTSHKDQASLKRDSTRQQTTSKGTADEQVDILFRVLVMIVLLDEVAT